MSCKPTYKGIRYNSLEELYKANGVNIQQAQQLYGSYLQTTNNPTVEGFKQWNNRQQQINELFESNPTLANEVYEALGLGQENNLPTSDETINIYAGSNQNAELSNFAIRPFTINVETPSGEKQYTFQSVEQGFHFYKALVANNAQVAKQILATTNGGQLKKLTNRSNLKMTSEQVKEWDDTSKSIMLNLMYDSYAQNPKAAENLLATGDAKITHTQDNTRWKTDFPEVVMTVRDMLKEEGFGTKLQITPQQKQQAQKWYSEYLEQNPNGNIEGFKEFVEGKSFDKELAQKIQYKLQKLYPEIKLNITNNPAWEQGDNIFDQKQALENEVAYRLKVVNSLINLTIPKGDKRYSLGDKPEVLTIRLNSKKQPYIETNLRKRLNSKGVTNQQIDFIFDYMKSNNIQEISTEQLALELASKYGFSVEINTAKEQIKTGTKEVEGSPIKYYSKSENRYYRYTDELGWISSDENNKNQEVDVETPEDLEPIKFDTYTIDTFSEVDTQHYSSLTVPGGTNYTENEISTPLIIPSIKGHAQFATDNGIGWFRSDDKAIPETYHQQGEFEEVEDEETGQIFLTKKTQRYGTPTKTRRVLELQSDLFQKGRDKKELTNQNRKNISFGETTEGEEFVLNGDVYNYDYTYKDYSKSEKNGIFKPISKEEFDKAKDIYLSNYKDSTENQFLQLLNKNSNWVTFFIKSIIQDSAKKGYEKVLFPKGETAAKIEGHELLAEEINRINNSLEALYENNVVETGRIGYPGSYQIRDKNNYIVVGEINKDKVEQLRQSKISELEQRKQELKSQGIEKLRPIEAFYEIKVGNILEKQFGKDNVKTITDEYGNQWREITINQARDLQNILLQKNEADKIIGQANIKALTVLIDVVNQKKDTLPHEYAHHYIAWYRNTPIVQEAIKKWGNEEALVQSIGEQVVKQKGEAYNWWNKFVKWVMNQFNSLSKLQKEELTQILTDAFLTRQDLNNIVNNSFQQFQQSKIDNLQSTIEYQLLNEKDEDLDKKVGQSYMFLSEKDTERFTYLVKKNKEFPKEFKVTKKITKYERDPKNPIKFNGYNEYVDFYYIKSNKNKKSNLYDIVNKETGEVIASKVRILSVSKDAKSEIAKKYGLEHTPTKIFNANRSIAFALYRQKPSKAKYIAQAKKYLYDAIKFLNPEETNLKINLDKIEELLNSFPEGMWDYINTTYSPENSTNINASISLQNEIKFNLPKLGFLQEIEKITGIPLKGVSFKNYDRSGSLAKIFKFSKLDGEWGSTITIDNSMTTKELKASIRYYLSTKEIFKQTSEEENVRKYAEHRVIDYSELRELVFGDIDKALDNIAYNHTGNSDTIELSKWRESIRNYDWQSAELFSKPYENFQNTVKERIIAKFKDKNLSNGISHLEYFFNSGSFNWLNINFNNISGQYYLSDMETEANVGVGTKMGGIINPFEMKIYQKPKAGENFLQEEEVFNRLAAVLHEPFHALHALSYGTKEELELRKAFDNLYKTDFGKEMMNQVFGSGYNKGQQVSYDTLYKEFTAFTTQLMLYPKQWIKNTDLRSNDIYDFIEKIQTLQDKTYEEIVKTQQKIGTTEKIITEEEKIKLTFLEKLYNYLVKALNKIIPLSKKFTNLIADSKLVEKKIIEDVFGEIEETVTKTLKLPENVKKSKEEFLQAMEELQSAINTLMQIDGKLFSSENISNFFTSNKFNKEGGTDTSFQQFQQSLNKPNTNPIFQGNQQEQILQRNEVNDLIPNTPEQLEIDFGQDYIGKNIKKTHNLFLEDKGSITTEEYEKLPYKDNGLTKTFYANSESDADYWVAKYGAIKVKLFGKDVGKYKMVIKKPFEIDDLPSSVEKLPKEIEEAINRKKNVIQALKLKISKDNSRSNELKSKINLLNSRINKIKEKYKSDDFKLYEIAYEDVKLISENLKSFEKTLEGSNLTSNELRIIADKLIEVSYDIKGWIDVHNLVSEKYFGTEMDIANITGAIKMLDSKYKKILTNIFVRFAKLNTIYTELSEEDLSKAVADISIYDANVHTIGKSDIKLLKIVDDLLNNTATDINLEYQNKKTIINNQLKKAIDKLKISRNDLKEFFKQKRSDGTWTGNIIGEFKQEFYDKQSELIEEAKESKNWGKYFKWLNKNSKSFTSKELVEISKMNEESITKIGRFSEKEVLKQKKLINDYRSFYMASVELLGKLDKYIDGELIINENESNEGISVEFKHDDAKIVDNFYYEIDSIIKENSPFEYLSNKEKKVNSKIKNVGYYYIIRNKPNENWEDPKFKEIKENETLMETYNMIMDTLNENNKYLPILDEYQSNYMPELAKPLLQRISNNGLIGMFGGLKNEIINSITEEINNSEEIRPIIGSQSLSPIPIKMMSNNIITENKEDDIFKVLIEHSKMAISYKYKSQIEPLANASLDLIDAINEVSIKTTKAGSEYVTKFGKIKEREGGLVNAKKALKFRIESFLNNKSKDIEGVTKTKKKVKNLSGEIVEKNISLSKILDFLLGVTYAKQLGAPNVISPTVNLAYGLVSNLSYAAGGVYVSEKNLIKSFMDLHSIAIGVNSKSEKTEKILTFIDSFGIFGNLYDTEVADNGFIQKITFLQQKAELINQGSLVLAILKTIKLKDKNGNDISIYDAYTIDNGHLKWDTTKMEAQELLGNDVVYNKEKTQINFKTLSSFINEIVEEVHGDYKNPMMIKKTVLMRAVMQYKRFIPNSVKHRFGKEYENMNLIDEKTGKRGVLVKGRYLSYINSKIFDEKLNQYVDAKFGDIVKILISGLLFNKKNIQQLKEIDRINMMRNIRELHFILLSMAAIMALESLINDDDDDDFMVKILINSISKTQADMMFFLNPSAMSQMTNNFIPVLSTIEDMKNLMYSSFKMLYGDIYYENGPWKDYSRLGVSAMRLFPGTNGAVKMWNYGSQVFEFN